MLMIIIRNANISLQIILFLQSKIKRFILLWNEIALGISQDIKSEFNSVLLANSPHADANLPYTFWNTSPGCHPHLFLGIFFSTQSQRWEEHTETSAKMHPSLYFIQKFLSIFSCSAIFTAVVLANPCSFSEVENWAVFKSTRKMKKKTNTAQGSCGVTIPGGVGNMRRWGS